MIDSSTLPSTSVALETLMGWTKSQSDIIETNQTPIQPWPSSSFIGDWTSISKPQFEMDGIHHATGY